MSDSFKFFENGRMMHFSKSAYREKYPDNIAVFNANLCTKNRGKIWYGDLDLTKDEEKLSEFAAFLGEELYVLSEMDARFSNEADPKFDRALAVYSPDGKITTRW